MHHGGSCLVEVRLEIYCFGEENITFTFKFFINRNSLSKLATLKTISSQLPCSALSIKCPKNLVREYLCVTGKLLFTTTTKRGSSPPRVSVYSAVLAEAKPENEPGVPSNALLHTFTLAAQDRILMVAPVQPNPLQEPEQQPEPKPDTAKKPFKLLVTIAILTAIFINIISLTLCIKVCVTTDENGVETKTNLVKPSPSSQSTSSSASQTSSQFETRAKV